MPDNDLSTTARLATERVDGLLRVYCDEYRRSGFAFMRWDRGAGIDGGIWWCVEFDHPQAAPDIRWIPERKLQFPN